MRNSPMASSDVPMGRRMNGSEMLMSPNSTWGSYWVQRPVPSKKTVHHAGF